jgi:hypothetical protein
MNSDEIVRICPTLYDFSFKFGLGAGQRAGCVVSAMTAEYDLKDVCQG